MRNKKPKRILAIASGGGHWQQLMLLRDAFQHHDVRYLTTIDGLAEQYGAEPSALVPDCNRHRKFAMAWSFLVVMRHVIGFRPHIVISTGALPGAFALMLGKLTGARTIWVDSVANVEAMSMSGKFARRFADLWLSQWEDVARDSKAEFAGAVL